MWLGKLHVIEYYIAELWYQICILFEGQLDIYPRHTVYCSYMIQIQIQK